MWPTIFATREKQFLQKQNENYFNFATINQHKRTILLQHNTIMAANYSQERQKIMVCCKIFQVFCFAQAMALARVLKKMDRKAQRCNERAKLFVMMAQKGQLIAFENGTTIFSNVCLLRFIISLLILHYISCSFAPTRQILSTSYVCHIL